MIGYHEWDIEKVISELGSEVDRGLSSEEAVARLEKHGRNELPAGKKPSLIWLFLSQFHSRLTYVLFAAAGLSVATGHPNDAYGILLAVLMDAGFGFWQERKAESAIERLRAMVVFEVTVMRDGEAHRLDSALLVPGDVVLLEEGDKVPADARVISSKDLRTDEAALTGESSAVSKSNKPVSEDTGISDMTNMVWMGTAVVAGTCRVVVTQTGLGTQFGSIAKSLEGIEHEKAPLEVRLDKLGQTLGIASVVLAMIVFVCGYLQGTPIGEMFFFAVAMVVSVIPEGLPAVLAVVLAIGVRRMAKRNAIIRHVPSVETLGVADVICTDKTGTLTENKMTVREIATSCLSYHVSGEGWEPQGDFFMGKKKVRPAENPQLNMLLKVASVCNKARLVRRDGRASIIGDPTEGAMVVVGAKAGLDKQELMSEYSIIDEIPFSSTRMYRSMLVESADVRGKTQRQIFTVGALEVISSRCSCILEENGDKCVTPEDEVCLSAANQGMAESAMRVIAVAYRDADVDQDSLGDQDVSDMNLLGIIGMIDPPRAGVADAVEEAKGAGVRIIMATGDQKVTAMAIGREVGIIERGARGDIKGVYTDSDVKEMHDEQFDRVLEDAVIFARVSPTTKLRIVDRLQAMGHVVAMTGDGVNDAPALKRSSIGVSMGITGTDVSKDVSDMVLADDNFISIVGAIEEGRIIFRNVKQTVAYLFMTNIGEVVTVLASMAMRLPLPLLPAQILWMNLVTDGFPDMALATEKRRGGVLKDPPRDRKAPILSKNILILTAITSTLMCVGTLAIFKWMLDHHDLDYARTAAFTSMAVFQLWNVFNMRSIRQSILKIGLFSNMYVFWSVLASLGMQFAVLYWAPLQKVFRTVPLSWGDWALITVVSSSVLFAVESYKWVVRRGVLPRSWI
jgi:Ca2+-transporting ATPase